VVGLGDGLDERLVGVALGRNAAGLRLGLRAGRQYDLFGEGLAAIGSSVVNRRQLDYNRYILTQVGPENGGGPVRASRRKEELT